MAQCGLHSINYEAYQSHCVHVNQTVSLIQISSWCVCVRLLPATCTFMLYVDHAPPPPLQATLVISLANLEGDESFDASLLGSAESVTQERVCDDELLLIKGWVGVLLHVCSTRPMIRNHAPLLSCPTIVVRATTLWIHTFLYEVSLSIDKRERDWQRKYPPCIPPGKLRLISNVDLKHE